MTEAEWLACDDPGRMLEHLGSRAIDRKLRLFVCSVIRRNAYISEIEWGVNIAEKFADGLVGQHEFDVARERRAPMFSPYILASWAMSSELIESSSELLSRMGHSVQTAEALRDAFGNPFRPVSFVPEWRTSTVLSLAQHIYDSRDFSPLPILADALQDAGCDHDDILTHCRDANATHVRGCWVVDLILGKS